MEKCHPGARPRSTSPVVLCDLAQRNPPSRAKPKGSWGVPGESDKTSFCYAAFGRYRGYIRIVEKNMEATIFFCRTFSPPEDSSGDALKHGPKSQVSIKSQTVNPQRHLQWKHMFKVQRQQSYPMVKPASVSSPFV